MSAPSKWAMEAQTEIAERLSLAVVHKTDEDNDWLAAIIQRHRAAAQAETVALLEAAMRHMALIEAPHTYNHELHERLRAHVAQLKEGAP